MQRNARVRTYSNLTHALRGLLFSALCLAGCTASVGEWPQGEESGSRDQDVGTARPDPTDQEQESDDGEPDAGTPDDEQPDEEPTDEEPIDEEVEEEPVDECATFAVDGPAVIQQQCVGCHAASVGLGGFSSAESASAMVDGGVVVPNSAATSRVFIRMSEGTMPPSGGLTPDDIAAVEGWINCGAP
jgi:hypothetical protein